MPAVVNVPSRLSVLSFTRTVARLDHGPASVRVALAVAETSRSRTKPEPAPASRRALPNPLAEAGPTSPVMFSTKSFPPPVATSVPRLEKVPPVTRMVPPASSARSVPWLTMVPMPKPAPLVISPLRPRTVTPGAMVSVAPVVPLLMALVPGPVKTTSPVPPRVCVPPTKLRVPTRAASPRVMVAAFSVSPFRTWMFQLSPTSIEPARVTPSRVPFLPSSATPSAVVTVPPWIDPFTTPSDHGPVAALSASVAPALRSRPAIVTVPAPPGRSIVPRSAVAKLP